MIIGNEGAEASRMPASAPHWVMPTRRSIGSQRIPRWLDGDLEVDFLNARDRPPTNRSAVQSMLFDLICTSAGGKINLAIASMLMVPGGAAVVSITADFARRQAEAGTIHQPRDCLTLRVQR
jgi:hypothetical protein